MKHRALFIFIDALGWEIVKDRPFLEGLVRSRHPLRTVFGYSSAAIPSILSGRMPMSHGHWSFYYYSPETSPFRWLRPLSLIPAWISDRGRVRHHISKFVQKRLGYTGYFQLYNLPFRHLHLFDYCEKRDLFKPGGLNNGGSLFDDLDRWGVPFHASNWRQADSVNIESAIQSLKNNSIRFAFVYLAELDGLLHRVGTQHSAVTEKINWYDCQIRRLCEAAQGNFNLEVYVFSDHGQADVHTNFDLMGRVEQLGLTYGKDYVAVYDSTMARFWFPEDKAEKTIRNLLDTIPVGRVLPDHELIDLGVYWPDGRFGQLIFLVDPGVLIIPSFMGKSPVAGMHGYHPDAPSSDAVFMTNATLEANPKQITDMYSLMVSAIESVADASDPAVAGGMR